MSAAAGPASHSVLEALAGQRFVALTTFRRSGAPVSTPVWVAWDGGALVVSTPGASGKVKRLRHQPGVELVPCSRTGRVAAGAAPVAATAQVLTEPDSVRRVTRALRRKYRLEYLVVMAIERVSRPRAGGRVVLRITPAS